MRKQKDPVSGVLSCEQKGVLVISLHVSAVVVVGARRRRSGPFRRRRLLLRRRGRPFYPRRRSVARNGGLARSAVARSGVTRRVAAVDASAADPIDDPARNIASAVGRGPIDRLAIDKSAIEGRIVPRRRVARRRIAPAGHASAPRIIALRSRSRIRIAAIGRRARRWRGDPERSRRSRQLRSTVAGD